MKLKMSNNILLTVILAIVFVNICYAYEDCGSVNGELKKLEITSCPDLNKRCILKRDTNVTLTMTFDLKKDVTAVTAVVYGVVLDVPIPFPLPNPDGCKDSGLQCPLKSGETYSFVSIMPVEKKYPKVTVEVKWELYDQNKEKILCVLIPAKIQ